MTHMGMGAFVNASMVRAMAGPRVFERGQPGPEALPGHRGREK